MSKSYREEQEAILWQLEDASFESGKQSGEDVEAIRKDNVAFALESLQVLHEREVRRIIGEKEPNDYTERNKRRNQLIAEQEERLGLKEKS